MFPYEKYPYTNFHDLNLGYFLTHFREIFSQWASLYEEMQTWKTATDEELATWKSRTIQDISTWQDVVQGNLNQWETDIMAGLEAWKTAFQTLFDDTFGDLEDIKTDAEAARDAALAAQTAAEAAAAAAAQSAATFTTDTTLTIAGRAADAEATGIAINKSLYKNPTFSIENLSKYMGDEESGIAFYIDGVGSVNNSNGNINSSSVYSYTNYINVEAFREITYSRVRTQASPINFGIAFYDVDKNYIYGKAATSGTLSYAEDTIPVPDIACYMRCSVITDSQTYGDFNIRGKTRELIDNSGNLWSHGNVNLNNSNGIISLPVYIPAGNYIMRFNAIGKFRSAGGEIWFQRNRAIGAVSTATSIKRIGFTYNENNEFKVELNEDAYSIAFLAGIEIAASAGGIAYFSNIQLISEESAREFNPATSNIDEYARKSASVESVIDLSPEFITGYYIATSTSPINISNRVAADRFRYALISVNPGEIYRILAFGQSTPRTWAVADTNGVVLAVSNAESGQENNKHLIPVDVVIPPTGKYLVVNHYTAPDSGYRPKIYKLTRNSDINKASEYNNIIPSINEDWKRYVVATYNSFMVINKDDKIYRSENCGLTWSDGLDISDVGIVKSYHVFANGCLAFFTNQKAYYTESFTSYSEATCYEADGTTIYQPAELENFYTIFDVAERKFINGQDMYVFGNYVVNGLSTTPPTRRLIWYSIDNGHTYRIAYEFNTQNTLTIRHVHEVLYYEPEDVFICTTGDSNATECWVLKLEYDVNANTWTVTPFNASSSRNYKWAMMAIWGDELFFTFDNTPGSVKRCKYADIADVTKHYEVLNAGNTADVVGLAIGSRGDMLVTLSHSRSAGGASLNYPLSAGVDCRTIFYSSDRQSFVKIFAPPTIADSYSSFSGFMPVTSNGHVICGTHGGGGTQNWNKTPSIFLDEVIKKAGYKDAFKTN